MSIHMFALSVTNGIKQPDLPKKKMVFAGFSFGFMHAVYLIIGWFAGNILFDAIPALDTYFGIIIFVVMAVLGAFMIKDSVEVKHKRPDVKRNVSLRRIIFQAVVFSLDAIPIGFATVSHYETAQGITFVIILFLAIWLMSILGAFIGKKFGNKFSSPALLVGGIILILLGIYSLLESIL